MIKNFFEWYQKQIQETKIDPLFVWNEFGKDFEYGHFEKIKHIAGQTFFFKHPNSKLFKIYGGYYKKRNKSHVVLADNQLAANSELIAKKKYKRFGFMTADYQVAMHDEEFYLFSPQLFFADEVELATLYQIYCDTSQSSVFQASAKELGRGNLTNFLIRKKVMLNMMTENCYDQLAKYFLMSIFEFSDDEHFNNIILCKNKNSKKFESVFVFDKESTVFDYSIAKGKSFQETRDYATRFNTYMGLPVAWNIENFNERMKALSELIKSGVLEKKYCDFLNELAQFNFCEACKEIYEETGAKSNQTQIDMFRFGSEKAGELSILGK